MIRPTLNKADAGVDYINEEFGHEGTIAPGNIKFMKNLDGSTNYKYMVLTCQDGCGTESYHPIGGDGRIRALVQEMFVRQVRRLGCPCGALPAARPFLIVIAHIKSHIQQEKIEWQAGSIT